MKTNKSLFWILGLMVVVAALYRIIPGRPGGFAPQLALAVFSGAVVKNKKWALVLPLLSMVLSDLIYQGLFVAGLSPIEGFYRGQWINYALFTSVTFFGFFIKRITVFNVLLQCLLAPTYFFLVSNFLTWAGVGEYVEYPKTWNGLMECYTLALPFYKNSLVATVVFSAFFFGVYFLAIKNRVSLQKVNR